MTTSVPKNKIITDRLLGSWIRCKRKAWLDVNEEKERKIWVAHRSLQLEHQYKSLKAFTKNKFSHGIASCEKGASNVIGLRLKNSKLNELKVEGHPSLIHRTTGSSFFGGFKYQPVIARQGKNITRNHRLLLALWGLLLENIQQSTVDQGLAISLTNKGLEIEKVSLTKKLNNRLIDSLQKMEEDLSNENAPELTLDRKKCSLCCWKKVCDEKAKKDADLSEINGVGGKRKQMLQLAGINNLNDIAKISSKKLTEKLEVFGSNHGIDSQHLIEQAKAQIDLRPKRLNRDIVLPELKYAPGVIIYDIESDPDLKHDFLHGFIFIKSNPNNFIDISNKDINYQAFLCLPENDENETWEKLEKQFIFFKDWPILHYGETERLAICKLAKKRGVSETKIKELEKRFIDIHYKIRSHWLLPVNSYSLKSVAQWLNFEWSQRNANGAQALLWWRQFSNLNNEPIKKDNILNKITKYNKDDCLATWEIAKWLLNN